MRLATVIELDVNDEPRPVFELPGGQRVPLRELFRTGSQAELDRMPIYFSDLTAAVQHLDDVLDAARDWARSRAELSGEARSIPPRRLRFLPPVPRPASFRDYDAFEAHAKATRARLAQPLPAAWYDQPAFYFANAGSLVGHDTPVFGPVASTQLDFELELGVIISRGGRDIAAEYAMDHIAGFTIINHFVARDVQAAEMAVGMGPGGKGTDFATAVGPFLVTPDHVRDRIDDAGRVRLAMSARLNGREIFRGNSAAMHYTWPRIIEHASRDAELFPGDLIASGPVGSILDIGPEAAGGWLKTGDVVELEIERLGILRTPIVDRPPPRPTGHARRAHAMS